MGVTILKWAANAEVLRLRMGLRRVRVAMQPRVTLFFSRFEDVR